MRNYLVIDSVKERALDFIKAINNEEEMANYAEHKDEAIAFYEDKKFFIAGKILRSMQALPIYAVYIHGEEELTQEETGILYNAMIHVHGLAGLDPDLPRIYRY